MLHRHSESLDFDLNPCSQNHVKGKKKKKLDYSKPLYIYLTPTELATGSIVLNFVIYIIDTFVNPETGYDKTSNSDKTKCCITHRADFCDLKCF